MDYRIGETVRIAHDWVRHGGKFAGVQGIVVKKGFLGGGTVTVSIPTAFGDEIQVAVPRHALAARVA